ncbi:hypothetical protein, partial [Shigella sonnei]
VLAVLDYTQLKSISDEEVREAILAVGQSEQQRWVEDFAHAALGRR